jgi:peptide chain release factor 1
MAREEIVRLETEEASSASSSSMESCLPTHRFAKYHHRNPRRRGRLRISPVRRGSLPHVQPLCRRPWLELETLDSNPSDLGGFREVIFTVTGQDAYKRLKYESGVHRVQRVPATEAQGRIHTSTATVAVLPEAEDVDVQLKPDDLEITVCRASGPGGQGVNTTDSAVQVVHKPSGMIVRCADGRSQQKNKQRALTVLRSRLLEQKVAEENARYAAQRKAQVGTGERNERIRTYNFPQNRLTDHRIELTLYNLPAIINGQLDPVIDPLMAHHLEQQLAAAGF